MTYVLTSICLLLQIEVILCYSVLTNSAPFLPAIYFAGAAVLTAAGLITRIMGFFFRIFFKSCFRRRKRRFISAHFPGLCTLSVSQHIRDSNRRLTHGRRKMSSVVTYSAASSSSPHIERQKKPETFLQFLLASHSFLSLIELYFLQKNAFYIATTF